MEFKREDFFDWKHLSIERTATRMEEEPWRIREILNFIADEMKKEEEFKEKMKNLKEHHEQEAKELIKSYGMEYLFTD